MPDPYSQITAVEPAVLELLINAMEVRAAYPRQTTIREAWLSKIDFPDGAHVLEAGCGSGALCRHMASWPNVGQVVGLDPSPVFLAKARQLGKALANLRFAEGDAHAMPFDDAALDVAVFHTCRTHVPGPEKALAEAFRVLRNGGRLAILEGDYATTTIAIGDHDPLQACVEAAVAALVHDRWLVRRLQRLVSSAGFEVEVFDSHGYLKATEPDYMLTLVDRGADTLAKGGRIDAALAEALKREARDRVSRDAFFGFIGFAGLLARKVDQ